MKYFLHIATAASLMVSFMSCKTVETAKSWATFNDSIQRHSPRISAGELTDDTVFYDGPANTFYRMNLYWRMIEIKPDSQKTQAEDFTYRWFTSYDNAPDLTKDSLIQHVQMYLFKDGRAVLRSLVFPEAKTRKPGKVGWKSSYRLDSTHLHTGKYVKKNKIRWGSFKVLEYRNGANRTARLQMDLYSPVISKKFLSKTRRPMGDRLTLTVRLSHFPNKLERPDSLDPRRDIPDFIKSSQSQVKQVRPDSAKSLKHPDIEKEIEAKGAGLNRAVVEYIDFKSDIGSNGGEYLKIAPTHLFGLGDVKGRFPAEMYFRLFEIVNPQ